MKPPVLLALLVVLAAPLVTTARDGPSSLPSAIERRDVEQVRALLSRGVSPSAPAASPPLVLAAKQGDLEIVRLLLAAGADPNERNEFPRELKVHGTSPHLHPENRMTALMHAARAGDQAMVEALIGRGAKVNAKTYFEETALMLACAGGHTAIAIRFVDLGADLHARADSAYWSRQATAFGTIYGGTALMYAVRHKHAETARALLARYKSRRVEQVKEVLFYAAFANDIALLRELVARGADPTDDFLVRAAAEGASRDILAYLLEQRRAKGRGIPAGLIVEAAKSGSLDKVKLLVESGVKVNARNEDGQNALYYAIYRGAPDVAGYLLERGIEVNVAGEALGLLGLGDTPLAMAVQKGDVAMVKAMLAKGADVNLRGKHKSALEVAKQMGRTDILLLMGSPGELRGQSTYRPPAVADSGVLLRSGELLHATLCASCHARDGSGSAPVRRDAPRAELIAAILEGRRRPGEVEMPENQSWLLDIEIAAIATFVRRTWGSPSEDPIQASEVARLRKAPVTRAQEPLVAAGAEAAIAQLGQLGYLYSESLFVEAVRTGDAKAVELFLAAGMSPAARHASGYTAMHTAASRDNVDALRMLLVKGADLHVKNAPWAGGFTPAFAAVNNCRGRSAALAYMLGHGLDVNHRFGQWTLLMMAASNGCVESTKLLIERGADLNARLASGVSALRLAKMYGGGAAVPVLLAAGARE